MFCETKKSKCPKKKKKKFSKCGKEKKCKCRISGVRKKNENWKKSSEKKNQSVFFFGWKLKKKVKDFAKFVFTGWALY